MDKFDQLKQQWNKTEVNKSHDTPGMIDRITSRDLYTKRERLARSSCIATVMCLLAPALIPICNSLIGKTFPVWFAVIYTIFFIVMAIMQGILYKTIISIDFISMTVSQACQATLNYRQMKQNFRITGIIMGAIVIGALLYVIGNSGDTSLIIGAWTGLTIGIAIGIIQDRRQRRLINDMLDHIQST